MLFLIAVIGCLAAAISGQTSHTLPTLTKKLDNGHSMENSTSDIGMKPIRLANGSGPCSGTVQVNISGFWQPLCEDLWSNKARLAVCRKLSCMETKSMMSTGTPTLERPAHLPVGNSSVVLKDTWGPPLSVLCDHGEWESCQLLSSVCDSGKSAIVNCSEIRLVRLMDGDDGCAGRVELMNKGFWGTVCDDAWNLQDANVVCQQLDCGQAIEALGSSYFQKGKGPIHLDEVNCSGSEQSLWECPAQEVHDCGHKEDASVVCSDSQRANTSMVPNTSSRPPLPTTESSMPPGIQKKKLQDQALLILCIVLGILLLASLIALIFLLLKTKRKYALPIMENHSQGTSTVNLGANNSYQEVSATLPKEEGRTPSTLKLEDSPKLFQQVGATASKDTDSDSDSDYERYDFHSQPPVPLSTFYNSQKHRVTEAMAQQNKFRMPPLQEDAPIPAPQNFQRNNSESSTSSGEGYCYEPTRRLPQSSFPAFSSERNHTLEQPPNLELAGSQSTLPGAPLWSSQNYQRHNSESSTSSGEGYCNSPTRKLPPSNFPCFSSERYILEQPPNLELAGSRATLLGTNSGVVSARPAAEDSSSTSSGECYENFSSPQVPPLEPSVHPEPPTPAVMGSYEDDSSSEDYDDIRAS